MTFSEILKNEEINSYIRHGDLVLATLGYTEHSFFHAKKCADVAGYILSELGYSEKEIENAKIAGYIHDIGNAINRHDHAHTGAIMAMSILKGLNFPIDDIAVIVGAIGNHDEETGTAVSSVSAALILADKSDVRRSRVRNTDFASFDKHDRVNYAVTANSLVCDKKEKKITLSLEIDDGICSVMDYFEIFLDRMLMCRRAADFLKTTFSLIINGTRIV